MHTFDEEDLTSEEEQEDDDVDVENWRAAFRAEVVVDWISLSCVLRNDVCEQTEGVVKEPDTFSILLKLTSVVLFIGGIWGNRVFKTGLLEKRLFAVGLLTNKFSDEEGMELPGTMDAEFAIAANAIAGWFCAAARYTDAGWGNVNFVAADPAVWEKSIGHPRK